MMKDAIRQHALELVGSTAAAFHFRRTAGHGRKVSAIGWREKNFGEMQWLERNADKRTEPQRVPLAGAESVIVLATSYHQENSATTPAATGNAAQLPVVARYARFDDYHDILGERLKRLTKFVDELGGAGVRFPCGMWTRGPSWNVTWRNAPAWASPANTPT